MVDLKGIEPSTSRMRTVRSTRTELQALIVNIGFSVKYPLGYTKRAGGDGEDRTLDLLNAIQALSQLSYAPKPYCPIILSNIFV